MEAVTSEAATLGVEVVTSEVSAEVSEVLAVAILAGGDLPGRISAASAAGISAALAGRILAPDTSEVSAGAILLADPISGGRSAEARALELLQVEACAAHTPASSRGRISAAAQFALPQ